MRLIYITADIYEAQIAENSGIDFVMVDLEHEGKEIRQLGRDSLISKHSLSDVRRIRRVLNKSKLLVRVNPISNNSASEINSVIDEGADSLMLPMFRTSQEVHEFLSLVNNRAEVQVLLETSSALTRINSIIDLEGIDFIHIGLNDLHIELKVDFMFELFVGDLLKYVCNQILTKKIPFGIGGVARIGGSSLVPAELILSEHVRLGSEQVILSRDFRHIFKGPRNQHLVSMKKAILEIRSCYDYYLKNSDELFPAREKLINSINGVVRKLK